MGQYRSWNEDRLPAYRPDEHGLHIHRPAAGRERVAHSSGHDRPSLYRNNIEAAGDNLSRSLLARLETDRDDPENRPFRHPDPLARTENNRGAILRALYTVLIGNPRRDENNTKTRFKPWMQLVGSA